MSDSEFPTPQGRTQIHQSAGTDINFALTRAGPTGSRALTRLPTSIREWPCESRLLCSDPKRISSPHWVNLVMPRRGSIPLGVSGCIGYLNINERSPHRNDDTQSDCGSVDSDASGNPKWPGQPSAYGERFKNTGDLSCLWKHVTPTMSYKRVWWHNQLFNIGIYGFPRVPFGNQILRGLLDRR